MDQSTTQHCLMCDAPDSADNLVQCDECHLWAHYSCAGVTDDVKDQDWSCNVCSKQLRVPKPKKTTKKGEVKKAGSKSDAGSVHSSGSKLEMSLQQLEEEQLAKERAMDEEKTLREKRLEMEKKLKIKRMQQELEMRDKEIQQERELKELELQQEQNLLARRLANEEAFLKKRQALRERFQVATTKVAKSVMEEHGAVGGGLGEVSCEAKVKNWLSKQGDNNKTQFDFRGAYPKGSKSENKTTPTKTGNTFAKLLEKLMEDQAGESEEDPDDDDEEEEDVEAVDMTREERELITNLLRNRRQNGPGQENKLSRDQVAARQSLSKHLPIFRGEPESWPIFISSFEYTTKACGFSNLDNLKRLQDSLQGDALEAVRSRLILPESVPDVIKDLRDLFGKPEKLLKALLLKVRRAPAPRVDRLESFIHFGITVKQLCDHLEASKLTDHLSNPMLVQELVDKLPPNYKLDWVRFKRFHNGYPLRIFTDFMNGIVSDVSEVAEFSAQQHDTPRFVRGQKPNKKEFMHVHTTPPLKTESPQSTKVNKTEGKPCWVCKRTDHKIRFCDDFKKLVVTDRLKVVEKFKLCGLCLNNHGSNRCNFKLRCNVGGCQGSHHPLLHRSEEVVQLIEVECNAHSRLNRPVIFRMVPVTLYVGELAFDTLAFLDEGSSATLVEETVADQLRASGITEPLVVSWTGNIKRYEDSSRRLDLLLSARGSYEKLELRDARTVTELVLPKQSVRFQDLAERYPHLRDLPVADHPFEEPKIIIGLDNLHVFAPLESRVGEPGEPIGVKSKLGWTVYGPESQRPCLEAYVNCHSLEPASNQALHDILRAQYLLEESTISPSAVPESEENRRAREILQTSTVRVGDRFETGLLWKSDERRFPDSYPMAVQRLKSLERKLDKDSDLKSNVHQQIADYVTKGYAHQATADELAETEPSSTWYLPLNVVLNPRKPGKVRLVWDAAATVQGISLNSELLVGPDMLKSLPAVINSFRERRIAFGADIKEMYHQIRINKDDKQAQRFLFRSDQSKPPQIYVMDVATFGSTCSPCSAQFVKNLNAGEFTDQFPEAAAAIVHKHYVDDYFDSVDFVEDAIKRASEVKFIHAQGGFQLRNWVSNSEGLLQAMGEESTSLTFHFNRDKNTENERVLGIIWEPKEDVFSFSTTPRVEYQAIFQNNVRPTKRIVLSCVMAMFDPLGFLTPFTIFGKILVQDLWRTGCEWDDPIDDNSFEKWIRWTRLLPDIETIKVPRSYFGDATSDQFNDLQLHVFTDASDNAYGCVAYFRIVVEGKVRCALVMSRSKVAPLKQLTIPRLELQAGVLGARMVDTVCCNHSYDIKRVFMWTDSRVLLSWIQSDQRNYKDYVKFRIGEIHSLTKLTDWRWVPSRMNIADELTKWSRDPCLHSTSPWFNGPEFLYHAENDWPKQNPPPANTTEELRAHLLVNDVFVPQAVVDVTRISKWKVLVRTMASVFRFVSNCKKKAKGQPIETLKATIRQEKLLKPVGFPVKRVSLSQEEYQKAECFLLSMVQAEAFGDEFTTLLKNKERPVHQWKMLEKSSPLYKLTPLIDDCGLIRMEGRTENGKSLPFDLRFPVILPKEHPVTMKIVQQYHERFGHGYRETVKNELRQRFFIRDVGAVVKKVAKTCMWCKVNRNRPKVPRMAALPVQRLSPYQRPFSYVGVDYLGPIEVVVGRHTEKRWIAVFTCLVVRAVHLEVVHSLTTQSCLMAIRRFICRRGPPLEFFSDNGTNFRGASKEFVSRILTIGEECADELTDSRTRWNFNPPAAPHMGGVWERLVRSVKEAMLAINDGGRLSDEILLTTIIEAEDMINSRPLTYVSQETTEVEALSPNHFLRGVSPNEPQLTPPPPHSAEALRNAYLRSQQLADAFWERWIKEYVPSINHRTKWFGETKPLKAGDLVYVVEGTSRKMWVRGVVEEPIVSSDGRIRQAWIRTKGGLFKRATANLAVLEISEGNTGPEVVPGPVLRAGDLLGPTPLGSSVVPATK